MSASTAPAHALRAALVLTAAVLTACAEGVTAPSAAAAGATFAYVPATGGTGAIDSTAVDPTPVPLQGGSASVPVKAYTSGIPEGTVVTFDCDGRTVIGYVSGGVAASACTITAPGVYPVTATTGGTPVPAPSYGVVFDPAGGFVTGGGWITSPGGAYAASPGLVTRASFGFVAKYLPGRPTPDGETEFQLRAAGFNFHGGTYQWLAVSGARAQYRGTGTVNNAGAYDFVVTAIDGHLVGGGAPDQFRIRITDRGTGTVVYDNQRGADEIGGAATALAGGSISIKK